MMKQNPRLMVVLLAVGIAAIICVYNSLQTSEPERSVSMQDVRTPSSEGSRIDESAPSNRSSKQIPESIYPDMRYRVEHSEAPESNSATNGVYPADRFAAGSAELSTESISDKLKTGEQSSDVDPEQDYNAAAVDDNQSADSDSEDYYGEAFFQNAYAFEDSDPAVRRQAVEDAAALRNDEAFEELFFALQDREAQNRVSAIDSIGRLLSEGAADEEQVFGALLEATTDPDPDVAEKATLLIQDRFGSQNPFSTVLSDQLPASEQMPVSEVEQDLNEAAAEVEDPNGEDPIEKRLALEDSNSEVRLQAIEDAAVLRNDTVVEVLSSALQDREALNRIAALESLGRLLSEGAADEEQVFDALLGATTNPDPDVADTAIRLIQDRFSVQNPFPAENEH